jgi:amino acid permease
LTDEIRKQFEDVIDMEQQLRTTRNEEVRRTTVWSIGLYLLFIAGISGLLAYIGVVTCSICPTVTAPTLPRSRPAPSAWSSKPGCAMARPSWLNRCWGN